jgi:hypothetical protein
LEKLVRRRLVVPDGDRRQTAESGGVVNEIAAPLIRENDIVGVLVLNDNGRDHARRLLGEPPHHDVVKRAMCAERLERDNFLRL